MPRHFECFPLVYEIPERHNVPVEHLPLECMRRQVYCGVSVLESWGIRARQKEREEKAGREELVCESGGRGRGEGMMQRHQEESKNGEAEMN